MKMPPVFPQASAAPLYSVVAWPPEALDTRMRQWQRDLQVAGFGLPHLNLRAPFTTPLSNPELISLCRHLLASQSSFEVSIKGWKRVPGVIFLECEVSDALTELHQRLLDVVPSSRSPHDGPDFRPHLTLALGVLPRAADELWAAAQQLQPPLRQFTVEALSLTREERGEIQELHTFPLRTGQ